MRKIYKNFYYSSKSTRFAAFFVGRRFYMPHFQKRGNRIRASDKTPVFRFSAGSLLLLFLTVVLLLNLKTIAATDWKLVHFLQDGGVHLTVTPYMIVSTIAALLIVGRLPSYTADSSMTG